MENSIKKMKSLVGSLQIKEQTYKKRGIDPVREWNVLLILVFVILISAGIASFYLYEQIKMGELFKISLDSNNNNVKIDQVMLNKTIENMNTKASDFEMAKSGKTSVPDPSI